jgi:hypothetical protein
MTKSKKHRLTRYIKVLGKQNSCNTYAACIGCYERFDSEELYNYTFTNKKPQVKNHLKSCVNFLDKIGSQEEVDEIINLTDIENEDSIKRKRHKVIVDLGRKKMTYLNSYIVTYVVIIYTKF